MSSEDLPSFSSPLSLLLEREPDPHIILVPKADPPPICFDILIGMQKKQAERV
jgi:hypothetical protein